MIAANGTEIRSYGRKMIKFKGVDASRPAVGSAMTPGFTRQEA
jgi:hypothetical protein